LPEFESDESCLFTPEEILDGLSSSRSSEESRLFLVFGSILIQAIRDYLAAKNPKNLNKRSIQECGKQAEEWLFYENRHNLHLLYSFDSVDMWKNAMASSFEYICLLFDWDPNFIRKKINEMVSTGNYYTIGRRYITQD